MARDPGDFLVVVANYTPAIRQHYRIGVPPDPSIVGYREVLNSDASRYGGGGVANGGRVAVEPVAAHGQEQSIALTLPPLAVVFLEPVRGPGKRR
jgi:1,4-alpha-glucan branching enzyme